MSWPKRKTTLSASPPLDATDQSQLGLEPAQREAIKMPVPPGFNVVEHGKTLLDKMEPLHGRDWKITSVRDGFARLDKVKPTLMGTLHTLALNAEKSWRNTDALIDVSTWDLSMALRKTDEHHDLSGHMIRWVIADFNGIASTARDAEQLTCRISKIGLRELLVVIRRLENQRLNQHTEASLTTNPTTKESNMDPTKTKSVPELTLSVEPHLEHTITLTGNDYTELLQLVMKYGTGTGAGDRSTSVGLRLALSRPETRVAE